MIRQALSVLLGILAEKLCREHIVMVGTWPLSCARCWAVLPEPEVEQQP